MDAPANRDVNGPGVAPCSTAVLNSSHSKAGTNASKTPKIPSPTGPSTSINMTPNGATSNAASYPTPVSTLVPLCNDDSTVSPTPPQPILPADANPVGGTSNTALPVESNFLPTPPADLLSPSQLTPRVHTQQQEEVQRSERSRERRRQWEEEQRRQQEQLRSLEHQRKQRHLRQMHQVQEVMAVYQGREQLPLTIQRRLQEVLQELRPQVMHPPSSFVANQPRIQDQASSSNPTAVPNPSSGIPTFPMHLEKSLKALKPGVHLSLEAYDSYRVLLHSLHFQQVWRKDPHLAILLQDAFKTRLELQSLLLHVPDSTPPKQFVSMREAQKAPSSMFEWQAEREIQKKNEELRNQKKLEEMRMALDHIYGVQSGTTHRVGAYRGVSSGSGGSASGSAHASGSGTKMGAPTAGMGPRMAVSMPASMPAAHAAGVSVGPRLKGGIIGSNNLKRKTEAGTGNRPEKRSRMKVNTATGTSSVQKPEKKASGAQSTGGVTKAGGQQSVGELKATEGAQHRRIAELRKNGAT